MDLHKYFTALKEKSRPAQIVDARIRLRQNEIAIDDVRQVHHRIFFQKAWFVLLEPMFEPVVGNCWEYVAGWLMTVQSRMSNEYTLLKCRWMYSGFCVTVFDRPS